MMNLSKLIVFILLFFSTNFGLAEELINIYQVNPFTGEKTEKVTFLRKILSQKEDRYVVQDFYLSGLERTFPYELIGKDNLNIEYPLVNGNYTELYENGNKKSHKLMKNGWPQGLVTLWYENGVKQAEYHAFDKEMQGFFIGWYPNGVKKLSGTFSEGKQIGIFTYWDKDGNKTEEIYWKSPGELSKKLEFDKQGNIIKETKFEDKSAQYKE